MTTLLRALAAAFLFCAFIPAPSLAQVEEESSAYDDSEDALTFNIRPGEIIAWRDEGEGLESGLMIYLTDEKGQELFDMTRLNIGEQLYVQMRGYDVYEFQILDPIVDSRIFLNLKGSERAAIDEFLPSDPGRIPKMKIRGPR
jgi:hypothetical protein